MLHIWKQAIRGQLEAALCTMDDCLARCPDSVWRAPVAKLQFNQAAFHAIFYTDVYLGENLSSLRGQDFHSQNASTFADYEELEDRIQQNTYSRDFLRQYVRHCLQKTRTAVEAETEASLAARCGFERMALSRMELYLSTIRHLQHHAAQLSLRLRLDADELIGWVRTGWREG